MRTSPIDRITGSHSSPRPTDRVVTPQTPLSGDIAAIPYAPQINPADRSSSSNSVVTNLILSSNLYKEAVQVLSSDTQYGSSYLSMLKMIPYGHAVREDNFWDTVADHLGATSGYENAVVDAYNAAMDEIRSLMQDYYSFLSRLPSEQVDQLRDAGINAGVTGEGVTTSGMTSPDPGSMISENPSQSEYRNTSLSDGVTSFVEFIGSMANLSSVAVNSKNILGLLDIAEREGYNKQETHDLILAGLGVTTDSPYRVLTPDNTPSVETISSAARSEQRVNAAEAGAAAKALDSLISVNVGDTPDEAAPYEIMSGEDWLTEISRFQIANRFGNMMITNLQNQGKQLYAGTLSYLEGEYNMANFAAQTDEANFKSDFFSNRDGSKEGAAQTSLAESLADIRSCEAYIAELNEWLTDYRCSIIENWGKQLKSRPNLAPYFYKAMFDFDMEDTFYHQNGASQGLKYGLKSLESIGKFIGELTGFKKPVKKLGQTVRTSGPKGETISETTYNYE